MSASGYKVIISERACQMLVGPVRFLAQKSPTAAHKIKNDLMDAISSLYRMPERFPFLQVGLWVAGKVDSHGLKAYNN